MNDYQTNYLTERDLAQIYKEDYIPMSKQLTEHLQLDTYVWLQKYAPNISVGQMCLICLRVLGCNVPVKYNVPKRNNNSEKNNSEQLSDMTDAELIDFYLKERRALLLET